MFVVLDTNHFAELVHDTAFSFLTYRRPCGGAESITRRELPMTCVSYCRSEKPTSNRQ